MIKAAVVGVGYWGPNLVRNLVLSSRFDLVLVIDKNPKAFERFEGLPSGIRFDTDIATALNDPSIDVIFVATPPETHFDIVQKSINANKHVWCEKPFTDSLNKALDLQLLAREHGKHIWVDFPYLYHPVIEKIASDLENGDLGKPLYYHSIRGNFGLYHQSVNVLSDLVIHDLAILWKLKKSLPIAARARMHHPIHENGGQSIAFVDLEYADGFVAHITGNQLSPVKDRSIVIGGDVATASFDDNAATDKLFYSQSDFGWRMRGLPDSNSESRLGRIWSPRLPSLEPLSQAIAQFANLISVDDCQNRESETLLAAIYALKIIRALEDSERSKGGPASL